MLPTFSKSERLCSKKILSELFKKGSPSVQPSVVRTFYLFPFRVLYIPHPPPPETHLLASEPNPALPAIVITVPKRTFKRAVDRNQVRRRVREAYRLNKQLLPLSTNAPRQFGAAYIAFLYTAKQIISFEEIEKGMKLALKKVVG